MAGSLGLNDLWVKMFSILHISASHFCCWFIVLSDNNLKKMTCYFTLWYKSSILSVETSNALYIFEQKHWPAVGQQNCAYFCDWCIYGTHGTRPRFAPSQWETSLQSNSVSHWLDANLGLYHASHKCISHKNMHSFAVLCLCSDHLIFLCGFIWFLYPHFSRLHYWH